MGGKKKLGIKQMEKQQVTQDEAKAGIKRKKKLDRQKSEKQAA